MYVCKLHGKIFHYDCVAYSGQVTYLSTPLYNKMSNYCCSDITFPSNFTLVILTDQEEQCVKIASIKADLG